jgi:hypothetical protein
MLIREIGLICLWIGYLACNSTTLKDVDMKSGVKNLFTSTLQEGQNYKKPSKVFDIPLPDGYTREKADSQSFEFYLRNLSLDTIDNTIYAFNGSVVSKRGYHYAIIKMDIGTQDLQQCADAIMRLRSEYLYGLKLFDQIHFNFLSDGKPRYFKDYCKGDYSYRKFRKYMDYIFSYANTSSLSNELQEVGKIDDMKIGDVFIQKGSPIGHAVIVVDMAIEEKTRKNIFLLAESYMPAQSIHILSNLNNKDLDPWYSVDFEDPLQLPTWTFYKNNLRRFK